MAARARYEPCRSGARLLWNSDRTYGTSPLYQTPTAATRRTKDLCTPPAFGCGLAGSDFYDRHFRPDVGAAYTELGAFGSGRERLVQSLVVAAHTNRLKCIEKQRMRRSIARVERRLTPPRLDDGEVSRPGIGAIDPVTGLALAWNPTKSRNHGTEKLYVTTAGLWVGSDGSTFAGQDRPGIAFCTAPK